MEINILMIVLAVLAVWRGYRGGRRGITGEIYHLMTLVISFFVLSVGILLYTSIKENDTKNIVLSVAVILITGLASKVITLIMKSLKAIAHLPIISLMDKVLGAVAGVAEVIVLLWIVYVVVGRFDTAGFGTMIMECTADSPLLQKLYSLNYVAELINGFESF